MNEQVYWPTQTEIIRSRQSTPAADHEKGSSDQKFPQVGHTGNDRTPEREAHQWFGDTTRSHPTGVEFGSPRSGWFDDKTKEIGDAQSSSQFEFGWIYRRSETGHRRERSHNRDSVS